MKEALRNIWYQPDKISAQQALDEWIKKAAASNVNMLKQFSKTLAAHRSGILAYFDFDGLSTGPLEGTNNKIKTLHMAYGFRDIELKFPAFPYATIRNNALINTAVPLTFKTKSTVYRT